VRDPAVPCRGKDLRQLALLTRRSEGSATCRSMKRLCDLEAEHGLDQTSRAVMQLDLHQLARPKEQYPPPVRRYATPLGDSRCRGYGQSLEQSVSKVK
jgi:hypothetical protein